MSAPCPSWICRRYARSAGDSPRSSRPRTPGRRRAHQRTGRRRGHHSASHGSRRLRLARALLRAGRVRRGPSRRRLRHGPGVLRGGRRTGAAAPLRGTGLPTRLRRSLPQPLPSLLRQPHLRKPSPRGRLPGASQGGGGLTESSAGGARDSAYGSEQQQIVQRSHEQQTADHRKEDHQRWLGKREETTPPLLGRSRGVALCCVQHLAAMMAQPTGPTRSTRPDYGGVSRNP